eukprot:SAG31_NODE_602_length_13638_cov_32.936037_10_plen_76_part_00
MDKWEQGLLVLVGPSDQRGCNVAERSGAAIGHHAELALHELANTVPDGGFQLIDLHVGTAGCLHSCFDFRQRQRP